MSEKVAIVIGCATGDIGIVAMLIDAMDEKAKRFYARYEFESLPDQPLTLWLPIAASQSSFKKLS